MPIASARIDDEGQRPRAIYDYTSDVDRYDYSTYQIAGTYQDPYVLSQLAKQEALEQMPDVTTTDWEGVEQTIRPQGPGVTPYMGQAEDDGRLHYTWTVDVDARSEFLEQEASTLRDTFDVTQYNRRAQAFDYAYNPFGDSSDAAMALQEWEANVFSPNEVAAQREYNSLRYAQLSGSEDFAADQVAQYKLWRYEDRLIRTGQRAEALEQVGDEEAAAQLREAGRIGTGEEWDVLSDPTLSTTMHVGVGATGPGAAQVQLGRGRTEDRRARAAGARQFEREQL
jgi:hypothetical protein